MESTETRGKDLDTADVKTSPTATAEPKEQPKVESPAQSPEAGGGTDEKSKNENPKPSATSVVAAGTDAGRPLAVNGECKKAEKEGQVSTNGMTVAVDEKVPAVEIIASSKTGSDKDDDDVILIVDKPGPSKQANGDHGADSSLSPAGKMEKLAMDVEKYIVASISDMIEPAIDKNVASKTQNKADDDSCGTTTNEDGEVTETCTIGRPIICGTSAQENGPDLETVPKDIKEVIDTKESQQTREPTLSEGSTADPNETAELEISASDTGIKDSDKNSEGESNLMLAGIDDKIKNVDLELVKDTEGLAVTEPGDDKPCVSPASFKQGKEDEDKDLRDTDITEVQTAPDVLEETLEEAESSKMVSEVGSATSVREANENVKHEEKSAISKSQEIVVKEKLELSESSSVTEETKQVTASILHEETSSESRITEEVITMAEEHKVEQSESVRVNSSVVKEICASSSTVESTKVETHKSTKEINSSFAEKDLEVSSSEVASLENESKEHIQDTESVSVEKDEVNVELGLTSGKDKVEQNTESAPDAQNQTTLAEDEEGKQAVAADVSSDKEAPANEDDTADSTQEEEGHDSGVDETTQSQNGESASPPKGGRASPRKRQPRSVDPSPMKRLSGSTATSVERKKTPMNKVEVGKSASPNLKQVRSKIGSLNNTTYKPGGGNIKIESKKLDYSKASSRIAAKNEEYKPKGGDKKIEYQKLKWNVQSKVGSLDNTAHKPGGGARKIESQKLNFKDSAQSKVGSRENIKHKAGGGEVQIQEQRLDFKEKASSKVGSLQNVTHRPGGGEKRIFDDKEYLRQRSNESRSPCKTPSSIPGSEYSASRPESPEDTNPASQTTSGVTSPKPDVTSPQPDATSPQPDATSPQPDATSPQPVET